MTINNVLQPQISVKFSGLFLYLLPTCRIYGLLKHKQASAHLSERQTIEQESLPRYGIVLPHACRQNYTPELTTLRIRICKVTEERELQKRDWRGKGEAQTRSTFLRLGIVTGPSSNEGLD